MSWIMEQFSYPADSLLVYGNYNPALVALSVLIAIFSSTMALQISSQSYHFTLRHRRVISVAVGAVALGGGVWSMHFIGMLAFDLHTHVDYMWQTYPLFHASQYCGFHGGPASDRTR